MSIERSAKWETFKQFCIIFLIAGILLCVVAYAHYWKTTQKSRTAIETNEITVVNNGKNVIERQLAGAVSDINYLAAYGEQFQTLDGKSSSIFDDTPKNTAFATFLEIFSQEKNIYDQIRFLNGDGVEVLRINNSAGVPTRVAKQQLQQKSSRYYVREVNQLKQGELYVSPLDLNIEEGVIELPYKPVLRFGKPLYNAKGQRKGALLLNFKGSDLLHAFEQATETSEAHIMLLNKDGYWMSHPDKKREWGFMFKQDDRFASQFPIAWERIKRSATGQLYADQHLISFTSVSPLPTQLQTAITPQWKVVSAVPVSHPALGGTLNSYLLLYGPIALLLAIGSWLIAAAWGRHRNAERQVEFEQRFRQVLEHVDLLAIGLDEKGTITFCNNAITQLTGWNQNELLGKNWLDTCVAESHKTLARKTMQAIRSGDVSSMTEDARIRTKEGEIRRVEWNHTLMQDAQGQVIGLTCIGENVTDIRAQEKQVMTLSQAVEQSPVVVMIVNTDGKIEYVNPRFTEVTGYTLGDIKGQNPSILRSESGGDKEKYDQLWKAIQVGKTWHGTFKNRKKNGEIYWASASISGIRDKQGKIVNYIGVQEDITERLELEQKFRMSVEGSPYAMVMIDEQGKIILVNSTAEEYFSYPRNELLGQSIEMLIPSQHHASHINLREGFVEAYHKGSRNTHGVGRNLTAKRKDGTEFPVEIALNLIDTDEGKITLASVIDITKRHALETELEQRNQEVSKSNTLAIIGRMASMVAHDLRNPLSSVKMGLQILSKHSAGETSSPQDEQGRELKKIALEQVSYMETILEDLLNYARPPALSPEWLDLGKILDESVNMLQGLIQQHSARINPHIQTGLPTLYADPGKLKQIFSNLIGNAIQAAGESGEIPVIRLDVMSKLGGGIPAIQIEIIDNGPGVDDKDIEKLFEPFYTTRSKGSGLGLAIVKGYIEQHQGQIMLATNTDGLGAICTIILPISALISQDTDA